MAMDGGPHFDEWDYLRNRPASVSRTIKTVENKQSTEKVFEKLAELNKLVAENDIVALAFVIVKANGASLTTGYTEGNRLMTLGAIADLQYHLYKEGD